MNRGRRIWIVASLLLHGVGAWAVGAAPVSLSQTVSPARRMAQEAQARAQAVLTDVRAPLERNALVRRTLAEEPLDLGAFLLQASLIDANAEGRSFEVARAELELDRRVATLKHQLKASDSHRPDEVREAVYETFRDLHYVASSRTMAEALLAGGGSCEHLAQLTVAALLRAGVEADVGFRYYGGGGAVAAHLTAVVVAPSGDSFDLVSGRPLRDGGVTLTPRDLVLAYGNTVDTEASSSMGAKEAPSKRDVGRAGADGTSFAYPSNEDAYPGRLPLFSSRAFGRVQQKPAASAQRGLSFAAPACHVFVPFGALEDRRIAVQLSPTLAREVVGVEPIRFSSPGSLHTTVRLADEVELELARGLPPADELVALACLRYFYASLADDLAFEPDPQVRRLVLGNLQSVAEQATAIATDSGRRGDLLEALRRHAGAWTVLLHPEGIALGKELVHPSERAPKGSTEQLPETLVDVWAALLIAPSARAWAMEQLSHKPQREQVRVLWAMSVAADPTQSGAIPTLPGVQDLELGRLYHCFVVATRELLANTPTAAHSRGIFMLWLDGGPAAAKALHQLERTATKARVSPALIEAFLGYLAEQRAHLDSE